MKTLSEILNYIVKNNMVDEVYEQLRIIRENEIKKLRDDNAEQRATLNLIRKITKDKNVRNILSEVEASSFKQSKT